MQYTDTLYIYSVYKKMTNIRNIFACLYNAAEIVTRGISQRRVRVTTLTD